MDRFSQFKSRAYLKFGDKFSYELSNYKGSTKHVDVVCKEHGGIFSIRPCQHLSSVTGGCDVCAPIHGKRATFKTREKFISQAVAVHGRDYDYSSVAYVSSFVPVDILCNKCKSTFKQMPSNHLSGHGCSSCAAYGYSARKQGTSYVLHCEDVIKVGITNRSTQDRVAEVNTKSPYLFSILWDRTFSDGAIAHSAENALKIFLSSSYCKVPFKFDGYTECFTGADKIEVVEMAETMTDLIKGIYGNY